MEKKLRSDVIKQALQARGWTQKDLSQKLQVTGQAVTNWLKGTDFPRPDKLLKLATTLNLGFDDLVLRDEANQRPIVAFRRKAASKTTDAHIAKAVAMGQLLMPLVPFLPTPNALRVQIDSPSVEYPVLQAAVAEVRRHLGLGDSAVIDYPHLLEQFTANGAVVVPVLWGERGNHKNALHILLPRERMTFVFVNLDTRLEDFKFWMAHELAHVYTPRLAGTNEGEDFADAFAAALLFPQAAAASTYAECDHAGTASSQIRVLQKHAQHYGVSLFSIYREVSRYALAQGLAPLKCDETSIHAIRTKQRGKLVSESLFSPAAPSPNAYLAAAKNIFRSPFFLGVQRMIHEQGVGAGYLQQILDVSLIDAIAIHRELSH